MTLVQKALLALILVLAPISRLSAAELVFELGASRDNTLYESPSGGLSNGVGEYIFTGRTNRGVLRRALLHFDVAAALPAGATVTSATLTLRMSNAIDPNPYPTSLFAVTKDWGEGTSDAPGQEGTGINAETGDATWLHTFFDTTTWDTQGGDFSSTVLSEIEVTDDLSPVTWPSTPEFVAAVQAWFTEPETNFGLIVIGNEEIDGSARRFDSRENEMESARPLLTVVAREPELEKREGWVLH